ELQGRRHGRQHHQGEEADERACVVGGQLREGRPRAPPQPGAVPRVLPRGRVRRGHPGRRAHPQGRARPHVAGPQRGTGPQLLRRSAPMRRSTRGTLAVLTTLALAGAVGCSSDLVSDLADSTGGDESSSSTASGDVAGPDDRLTVLAAGPVRAWDPQRITDRRTAGFASRTWMRTLTAYQPDSALSGQRTIAG